MSELQHEAIKQHCRTLRMPTIGAQFAHLAEAAVREQHSHIGYLDALLTAEMEERESRAVARLLHEARLPRIEVEVAPISWTVCGLGSYVSASVVCMRVS